MRQNTPNSDRYANQVALMREQREQERESAKVTAPAPKAAAIKKQDPVPVTPPIQPKPNYLSVIAASVEMEGQVVISEAELAAMAGYPEKNRHALAGFCRAAYARGLAYTIQDGQITFSARH
jgi:hypothetical protein